MYTGSLPDAGVLFPVKILKLITETANPNKQRDSQKAKVLRTSTFYFQVAIIFLPNTILFKLSLKTVIPPATIANAPNILQRYTSHCDDQNQKMNCSFCSSHLNQIYLYIVLYKTKIFQQLQKSFKLYNNINIIMLTDLQKVENNLYTNESIEQFLKVHPIFEAVKMLNKTNKNETKMRIKQFFYKIVESNRYKDFLLAGLDETKQNKDQFLKYIASQNSQQYFELLQKKIGDVIMLLDTSPSLIPLIFSLVHSNSFGIKMIKVFSQLYSKYSDHNCLYSQQIKHELQKGLESQDSVVQMRFVEIIANIATQGGRSFLFVKDALQKSLNIYDTQDILLKLNIVQIISVLGDGAETSQLLRGHKVWAKVEKDALDHNQQFYVRKSLLILLINMSTYQQYEMTPKFMKNIIQFLHQCYKEQGQYLQAGLQLSSHLLRSNQGAKLLVQNNQVFGLFLKLSRSPQQRIKNLFVQNLTMLTNKTNGKKTKPMVMNILNCVGNPNLSIQISHNFNSNNFTTQGIEGFCQWFVGLLQLPFEDLQLKLISLFYNLLEYNEICQTLFQDQGTTKYLLRPVGKGNTVKVLKSHKNQLVIRLIEKGKKDWKNTKLQTYAVMIQKQLQKQKMQVQYALDTN